MIKPLKSSQAKALSGSVRVPGDKSISHRALMFGALAVGESRVEGLLEGDDVLRTAAAMRARGAEVERQADGTWVLHGRGVGGLQEPADVLDLGNSGTGARLMMGLVAAHPFTTLFPGDAYVQAVRIKDGEDDLERFYRAWKTRTPNVIVQKHDDFCGCLPVLKATDLSPVKRFPCRHLMRDLSILIDGAVPFCREDARGGESWGNAFEESLEAIWARGAARYAEHCAGRYPDLCENCDEYYTYNF